MDVAIHNSIFIERNASQMTPAQIQFLNKYSSYDHNDILTNLNIIEQLAIKHPKLLPITEEKAIEQLKTILPKLTNHQNILPTIFEKLPNNVMHKTGSMLSTNDSRQNYYQLKFKSNFDINVGIAINEKLTSANIVYESYPENQELPDNVTTLADKLQTQYNPTTKSLVIHLIAWTNNNRSQTDDETIIININKATTTSLFEEIVQKLKQIIETHPQTEYYIYYPKINDDNFGKYYLAQSNYGTASIIDLINLFNYRHDLILTYKNRPIFSLDTTLSINSDLAYGASDKLTNIPYINDQTRSYTTQLASDKTTNVCISNEQAQFFNQFIAPHIFKKTPRTYTYLCAKYDYNHALRNLDRAFYDIDINLDLDAINKLLKSDYKFVHKNAIDPDIFNQYYNDSIPNGARNNITLQSNGLLTARRYQTLTINDQELIKELSALCSYYQLAKHQNKHLPIGLTKPLSKLLYQQQSKIFPAIQDQINIEKDSTTSTRSTIADTLQLNSATHEFLNEFNINPDDDDNDKELRNITVKDMSKYIQDIINNNPVDPYMLNLLLDVNELNHNLPTILNNPYVVSQIKNLKINNVLSPVSLTDKKSILDQIEPSFKNKITQIYQINNQPSNDPKHKFNHKLLVHGTGNISVLNILGQGLLDSQTLADTNNKNYRYTGSGLGVGIYFARPDQITKSYNYTESSTKLHSYIFVADVAYQNIGNYKSYHEAYEDYQHDLIWAHGVGTGDRDEFLAKHPSQVQLKYLLVI